MDISIDFNNQTRLVTVKIDDESLNNLPPPKADFQLLRVPSGGHACMNSIHVTRS
jgi:hypothetical protein